VNKIPVHIITGFLGAGKTTFLIDLLKSKREHERWALIINEFGKVSIDSQTVQDELRNEEQLFELAGGCICCSASHLFRETLQKVVDSASFDRVIVEPSGLGGPEFIAGVLADFDEFEKMPVICLVNLMAVGQSRMKLIPLFRWQILHADHIVFSHIDLIEDDAEKDKLIGQFKETFSGKRYCLKNSHSPRKILLGEINSPVEGMEAGYVPFFADRPQYEEKSFVFGSESRVPSVYEIVLLVQRSLGIIRAKGHFYENGEWTRFNYNGQQVSVESCGERKTCELVVIFENAEVMASFCRSVKEITGVCC